jgi:hypothetical protein
MYTGIDLDSHMLHPLFGTYQVQLHLEFPPDQATSLREGKHFANELRAAVLPHIFHENPVACLRHTFLDDYGAHHLVRLALLFQIHIVHDCVYPRRADKIALQIQSLAETHLWREVISVPLCSVQFAAADPSEAIDWHRDHPND